jgi:type II secretory pathway component PulC
MSRLTDWIVHEAWIVALELALVAALAISLAYWTWVALSPPAVGAPMQSAGKVSDGPEQLASRNLFGVSSGGVAAGPRTASAGITLLGVFSGKRPGEGRAILVRQGSRPTSVAAGESITEGLALQEVHPDHVIILRNGAPERVDLERRSSRSASPGGAAPAGTAPAQVRN